MEVVRCMALSQLYNNQMEKVSEAEIKKSK